MLVTIFTPTYNRGYIIEKLYASLLQQTNKKFEWIVINDGSSDDTDEIIQRFIDEDKLPVTYLKVENGGKQRAVNKGINLAKGDLFFIVDSDDYITDNAVDQITSNWEQRDKKQNLAGLCFRKVNYNTLENIGGDIAIDYGAYNSLELHYKLGITGDKAEIFRTDVIKQFKFPEIQGENFVPEAYIWNRIGEQYKLIFVNKGIYMCEYLADGLSANFWKNLKRNPRGFALYYKDVLRYKEIPLKDKCKSFVRFIQCKYFALIKR